MGKKIKKQEKMKTKENIRDKVAIKSLFKRNPEKNASLRSKMLSRLSGARFRFINEQLYLSGSGEKSSQLFKKDPISFKAYHQGFQQQVKQWPINPVDRIIKNIRKRAKKGTVIVDFGCGEAKVAQTFPECTVHSLDLLAANEHVTVSDMSNSGLDSSSADIAIFCLSLMGTNLNRYIKEARRVLKEGGILKIAEIESRFEDINTFITNVSSYGFKILSKDLSHQLFYFIDFKKSSSGHKKQIKLPDIVLKPCLYKKR